jgi:hypothetical protein
LFPSSTSSFTSCLSLPTYSPSTVEKITTHFKKCNLLNVIDISPILDITPMMPELGVCVCVLMGVDVCLIPMMPEFGVCVNAC